MGTQKNELLAALDGSKGGIGDFMEKEAKSLAQKAEVEAQLAEQLKRLEEEQDAKNTLQQAVKKAEGAVGNIQKDFEDMEVRLQQAAADKETKDAQLKSLADEI